MTSPSRPRFPRDSTTGVIPDVGNPGSFALNLPDKKIYVYDEAGNPVRFTQWATDFDAALIYQKGDIVLAQGDLWRLTVTTVNGAFVPGQWERLTNNVRATASSPLATGIISGGTFSHTPPDVAIDVNAGEGVVIDNTDMNNVSATSVGWSAFNMPLIYPNEAWGVIGINAAGIASQVGASGYTSTWRRSNIEIAVTFWDSPTTLALVQDFTLKTGDTAETYRDEFQINGGAYRARGARIVPVAGTLNFGYTEGTAFSVGAQWRSSPSNPNIIDVAAVSPTAFLPQWSGGVEASTSDIDPTLYDNGVTLAAVGSQFTIQYITANSDFTIIRVQYGQTLYASADAAILGLVADWDANEVAPPDGVSIILAALIVQGDAADLDAAQIVEAVRGATPFLQQSGSFDDSSLYKLDGSRALTGDMDAGGFNINNALIDGTTSTIMIKRLLITGQIPAGATAAEVGEIITNVPDRKVWVRDGTGSPIVVGTDTTYYDETRGYVVGDLAINGTTLVQCINDIIVPEAFNATNWQQIGGAAANALITDPTTPQRNTVNLTGSPTVEGLVIKGDPLQAANLQEWPGTQAGDTGLSAIDPLGFPNNRMGAASWRETSPAHPFSFVGQQAGFSVTTSAWVLADASDPDLTALATVQEFIDVNTFTLRQSGVVRGLETGAFAGGSIGVPGTLYYLSETVPGQLTTVAPAGAGPAMKVISATEGVAIPPSVASPQITVPQIVDALYKIGDVLVTATAANPATRIGWEATTWIADAPGRALIGVGTADGKTWAVGEEAGAVNVTLTLAQTPSHNHSISAFNVTSGTESNFHNHSGVNFTSSGGIGGSNVDVQTTGGASHRFGATDGNNAQLHTHTMTIPTKTTTSKGSGSSHNNLQPSVGRYFWRRTA